MFASSCNMQRKHFLEIVHPWFEHYLERQRADGGTIRKCHIVDRGFRSFFEIKSPENQSGVNEQGAGTNESI